jgi:hypothetical protein
MGFILHRPGLKHTNVDALSKNLVGEAMDDDDFSEEIQDIGNKQDDSIETIGRIFSIQYGKESDWFGFKRHSRELTEHNRCCFGINHWRRSEEHQLFMLNVVTGISQNEENNSPMEDVEAADNEENRNLGPLDGKQALKQERARYYDRQQQLELVLAAQELSESGDLKFGPIGFDDEEDCKMGMRCLDI